MIKLSNKHTVYEVWNELLGESVYVDHKPTKEELKEIRKEEWPGTDRRNMPFKLKVFKMRHFYITDSQDASR